MYLIDRAKGTCKTIGRIGEHPDTKWFAALGARLYRIDKRGRLFEIDAVRGGERQLGADDFADVVAWTAYQGTFLSFEKDGSLYEVTVEFSLK